ncbi:MAG: hypothetical protein ACI861_001278 [Paracoccaceae bacterium]|jgi:hypothetical protein
MTKATQTTKNIIIDCWTSLRSMPGWVQVWMMLILVPVNAISLAFIGEDMGLWIAFLANIGVLPNLPILIVNRGFSNAMALAHIVPWTILIAIILFDRPDAAGAYDTYLWALLIVNGISLAFDYPDALKWFKGDRAVAGRYFTQLDLAKSCSSR